MLGIPAYTFAMNVTNASGRQIAMLRNMRRKKYRREQSLFLAEGRRTVMQILGNGRVEVLTIFLDETNIETLLPLLDRSDTGIDIRLLQHDVFTGVADTEHTQGILALCRVPQMSEIREWSRPRGYIIALDGLRDPGNMGTIIRTATWFGASGLILSHDTVDPFHPKVVRSTAGATGSLPYYVGDLTESLINLSQLGWKIFFLEDREGGNMLESDISADGVVLVVGSEAMGIRLDRSRVIGRSIRIPKAGDHSEVESLNAAVAASIALYVLAKVNS